MANTAPKINLISGRKEGLRREKVAFAKAQFLAITVMIAFCALIIAVFVIRGLVTYQLKAVANGISTEELAIARLKPVEEKYIILTNKLNLIEDYLQAKGDLLTQVDALYTGLPSTVIVNSIETDVDAGTVAVTSVANDLQATLAYLDQLETQAQTKLFTQANMQSLSRSADGSYNTNTEYQFKD